MAAKNGVGGPADTGLQMLNGAWSTGRQFTEGVDYRAIVAEHLVTNLQFPREIAALTTMHLYSVADAIKLYWDEYSPGQTFPSVEADSCTADLLHPSPNNINAEQEPSLNCISQHDWNSRLSRQLLVLQG